MIKQMKMKYRTFASLLIAGASVLASAQQISPLAKAMLDGYSEILSQNPQDYQTLYERAAQYYSLSIYDQALIDISKAIQYTPAKETALLAQEYSLLADIKMQEGEYEKALDAVNKALGYAPDGYADIYKKGNICLYLKRPEDAYRAFSQLQRFKSRSQEAYFGMAKARIMQGNVKEAQALMEEAEKSDPSNWLTYCRLGDLCRDMNDNTGAARSYISAFALADNSSRPLESLLSLGAEDYPSVAAAFDNALGQTDNKLPLYFLKANIANRAGAYSDAEAAFEQVLANPDGKQPGVWAAYAEALFALDKIDEALKAAENAVSGAPTVSNYALLSRCLLASGDTNQAALVALKAYAADEHSPEAMTALVEAQLAGGNHKEALTILNEMIVSNPENVEAVAMRAYVKDLLGDLQGAKSDWQRGSNLIPSTPEDTVWVALCKNRTGKTLDADAVLEPVAENADKNTAYLLASYYATIGNTEKGKQWLQKAIEAGYANLYNLNHNTTSLLNVSTLR